MDDSTQKNPLCEDSVSMYLSFADDTMMSTNTAYNTVESVKDFSLEDMMTDLMVEANKTLEAEEKKLPDTIVSRQLIVEKSSPLRPFDKNIFNKFNTMSSTPSKDIVITAKPLASVYENSGDCTMDPIDVNKENTHPDLGGDASSLSSTVDGTSSKTLVMSITDDESVQEVNKNELQQKTSEVLPSVKKTQPKLTLHSQKSVSNIKQSDEHIDFESKEEDIKDLIDKMLKLTEKVEKKKSSSVINSVPSHAAKMRGSLLPTAIGDKRGLGFKQRMSVVVKTTLNSPARKMANKIGTQRRSVLPVKSATVGYSNSRQSLLPTAKPSTSVTMRKSLHPSAIQVGVKMNAPGKTPQTSKYNVSSSYSCPNCDASFRIKSLLDAHKRSHEEDGGTPNFIKKTLGSSVNASTTNSHLMSANQCKYCDKKFAIERALHIHLMQNCTKIPPSDKRKLEFTELNHVQKAQLPVFPHGGAESPHMIPNVATSTFTNAGPQTSESLKTNMLPPSSAKKPRQKNTPHAGIYRTPTKTVPCHICKQSFKSILDYTNHSLTMHSTSAKNKQTKNEAQSVYHLNKK